MAFADQMKDSLANVAPYAPGLVRGAIVSVIEELYRDVVRAPLTVRLFKHYTEGTGQPYRLSEIPLDWQHWIVSEVARRRLKVGGPYEMKAYDRSAPFELRHSLGTFRLTITTVTRAGAHGRRRYRITDLYTFGFNCKQLDPTKSRHGFLLPKTTSKETKERLGALLPTKSYQHPCGFQERFIVEEHIDGTYLMLPQVWLADVGKAFEVRGEFAR
jgi:hypothetical protein